MSEANTKGYITVRELSDSLGGHPHPKTIYRLIQEGQIPHVKLGKTILVPFDVLDQMRKEHQENGRVKVQSEGEGEGNANG